MTLIEICLVLALLVVIASFAVPLLGGAVERRALMSGAGMLQAGLTRARLAAMQSGQTYVVRFEPKGSRFQVLSLDQLALPESQELAQEDPDAEHSTYDILRLFKTRLPDGVVFAHADVSSSNQLTATMGSTGDGPWSAPILFRPDGTTSDASVLLVNEPKPCA
jgi:type II secretory pathway pseudopilin PulG